MIATPSKNEIERLSRANCPEVELVNAASVEMTPMRWLWDGWLARGKLHICAGAPGTGKTTVALALAASITTAGRWPDGTRAPLGSVLIWSGEDDPADTLVPRLRAMGAETRRIDFIDCANEVIDGRLRRVAFDPSRHLDALAVRIASDPPVLLIVDPIVSAVSGDSHKNAEVRRALQPLVDIARLHGVAILGITHFSKGTQGRDPTERVTGSLAFGALARIVFVCSKTRDGDRVFMKAKANITIDEGGFEYDIEQCDVPDFPAVFASRVLWGAVVEGNARDVLAGAEAITDGSTTTRAAPEPTATDEAIDALREVLAPGPLTGREVIATMKSNGFSEKVIRLAREHIGLTVKRRGGGKAMRTYWSLPESPHSCPEEAFLPSVPDSDGRAGMDSEGMNGDPAAVDEEIY